MRQATLGGGCFWCLEAVYQEVKGVTAVVSGYAGGDLENPTDQRVYYENTGHAEVVQISFDESIISYRELLEIFYYIHDPTTLNRQGSDVGDEYRSVIFYHDDEQKKTAETMTTEFAPTLWDKPIVTQIAPLEKFWPAAEYHQNFYRSNPRQGYCQVIINPKLAKFRQHFAAKLK
jgi:peptide-methionine (S)-S-oxide reductase